MAMEISVLGVDPGREKSGVAVVCAHIGDDRDVAQAVLAQTIVATETLTETLIAWRTQYAPQCLVIGDGTSSRAARARLEAALSDLPIEVVDEYRTTDEARRAYWAAHPPTGLRRLIPLGMQVPPVPVDDFAAVLIAKRYLDTRAKRAKREKQEKR